jgi:hypothetical protein
MKNISKKKISDREDIRNFDLIKLSKKKNERLNTEFECIML